jgi:peptidase E
LSTAVGRVVDAKWLDVGDPAVDAAAVSAAVAGADCVYVEGGNTFWLAHHLRRTSFREALMDACSPADGSNGASQGRDPLYVGISAGAIVAGKSIATALWKGYEQDPSSCRSCSFFYFFL